MTNKALICAALTCCVASAGAQVRTSIGLTSGKLGLGNIEINGGKTVNADIASKLITSSVVGHGSILYVRTNGLAGQGSDLLATITAKSHLDTVGGPGDHYAGAIYMTKDGGGGLGVRAFSTDNVGLRLMSGGLAKIEGSKGVSGGNGYATFNPSKPNGAPHVDEAVYFDYNSAANVGAKGLEVTLNGFKSGNKVYFKITTAGGKVYEGLVGTSDLAYLTASGSDSYRLKFTGVAALTQTEIARQLEIRAVNPNLADTSIGTKEHFLIDGFSYTAVPEPATMAALGLGVVALIRKRKKS